MTTPSPPPSSRAGPAHAALAFGGFAFGTAGFAAMGILPLFVRDLHLTVPEGGRVVSAYALGVVVGALPLAVLGARASRRTTLLLLMACFAAGNLLSAAAPGFDALLASRFLSGLPHGAYFGLAALVAAGLVPPARRPVAVGRVMLGLTLATAVGAPSASLLAGHFGWRSTFGVVAGLAFAGVLAVWAVVPHDRGRAGASPAAELDALRRGQVWLTLGIGAIGFGGMFAIYTYLVPTLAEVTRAPSWAVPAVLALFGVGMTLSNVVVPRLAGRAVMPASGILLLWGVGAAALYPAAAHGLWSIAAVVVAVGAGGALSALLQLRLKDVAGEGQALAAALNHSAFNAANALGPWLGRPAFAAGWGLTSTGWVAAALALAGFAIWSAAVGAALRAGGRPRPAVPA